MQRDQPLVYVIDDDVSVRDGLDSLLRAVGYDVSCLGSALQFPLEAPLDRPACLVLDVRMPGPSGIEFQAQLAKRRVEIPIVFLTGHGDVPTCAEAMKAGAVDSCSSRSESAICLMPSRLPLPTIDEPASIVPSWSTSGGGSIH